jgi:myo-inositol 2-dehydrogenase/D-chiro-inositol 1-dehydrogenase
MLDTSGIGRREFLAAAGAVGLTIVGSGAVRGAEANSQVEIGLIGCGGRGQWIADLVHKNSNGKIVAVCDYFRDRVDEAGTKLGVGADRRYVGLDGYRKLLESKLDAVMIISPPYFHPEQAVAAMEKGKHVYLAKPIAVDVPGVKSILEAAKKVEGKQCVLVDFQTRMDPMYQGAVETVHKGTIGQLVCGQSYYHDGRLGLHAKPGSEMARLRNWVFDIALSGDIIVEQNIHVLDVANWILQAHPVKAMGTGGRKSRVDVGDCWDHFVVTYWYPNDFLLDFSSSQFFLAGIGDLCTRIYGQLGTIDTHYGGNVMVRAKEGSFKGGPTSQIYQAGAVANIKNFCAAISAGKTLNNIVESANSTLTSILGRTAARRGGVVTWDEMMAANEKLDPKLNLPENGVDFRG